MPANRSRTEHWRDNLQKVVERGGSLELAIASPASGGTAPSDSAGTDVVWRVKLLAMRHDALVVEQPAAFGSTFKLLPNIALIGAMTI
ncbi:MAG TPA: hypothetical protein PK308_09295, partial [Phycisphaerales bacterium]|nr:hypothetical protein [Phycisphaerales bacterium]